MGRRAVSTAKRRSHARVKISLVVAHRDGACLPFRVMKSSFLLRLDEHDRALFDRFALDPASRSPSLRWWRVVTHLGGATSVIALVLVPLLAATGAWRAAAVHAAWTLLFSHLVVQLVKRRAVRERPESARDGRSPVRAPDKFSFPSGHACSSMSVAFAYGMSMPVLAAPLVLLALLVGISRVRLGVHYPGDVLAGQVLAIITVLALWPLLG